MKDSGSVGSKRIIYTVLLVSVLILALAAIAISGAVLIRNGKITPPDTAFAQSSGDKDEKGNGDRTVTITDNMIDVNAAGPSVAARIAAGDKAIKLSNGAETGMLTAATGTRSDTYSVINFTNRGAAAELHADISEPVPESASEPVVIAIREIHRENGEVLAYRVYVDGSAVYFRTYGQIASAPNVLYVLVPRSEISDFKNVGIKIVSESRAVFSVADVTVYTRLFETEAEENPDDRLGIYLHSADSVDKAKAHISDFSGYSYGLYRLGLLFKIDYMNKTPDK